jgi:hypothetical protein
VIALVRAWLWGAQSHDAQPDEVEAFASLLDASDGSRNEFDEMVRSFGRAWSLPRNVVTATADVFASHGETGNLVSLLVMSLSDARQTAMLLERIEHTLFANHELGDSDRRVLGRLGGLVTIERAKKAPRPVGRAVAACAALVVAKSRSVGMQGGTPLRTVRHVAKSAPQAWTELFESDCHRLEARYGAGTVEAVPRG